MLTAADVVGKRVTTIEGLATDGDLHPVQEAWLEERGAMRLLPAWADHAGRGATQLNRNPSDADIDQIMNVCRCSTYCRIRKAIKSAASDVNRPREHSSHAHSLPVQSWRAASTSPAGLLLAAGAGRRMGTPKALVDDWLVRGVDVLAAAGCSPVVVVLGAAAVQKARELLQGRAVIAAAADWSDGLASLRTGIGALQ